MACQEPGLAGDLHEEAERVQGAQDLHARGGIAALERLATEAEAGLTAPTADFEISATFG